MQLDVIRQFIYKLLTCRIVIKLKKQHLYFRFYQRMIKSIVMKSNLQLAINQIWLDTLHFCLDIC